MGKRITDNLLYSSQQSVDGGRNAYGSNAPDPTVFGLLRIISMKKYNIACLNCGKNVISYPSRPRVFCSLECSRLRPNNALKDTACLMCSVIFRKTSANQKYCGSGKKKTGCAYIHKLKDRDVEKSRMYAIKSYRKKHIEGRKDKSCGHCGKEITERNRQSRLCFGCKEEKENYRRSEKNWRTRFRILSKFNFTCQYCGRKPPDVILHIDHIQPKAKGGSNSITNLTVACKECNVGKSDILLNPSQSSKGFCV